MDQALTLDQQKALALASARLRLQRAGAAVPEAPPDPTAGMSTGERVLANVGAGMADLGLGARGLYADMFGSADDKRAVEQDVAEKRARDKTLANSVPGGGVLQAGGGILPWLAVPGAPLAAGAGRLAVAGAGALSGALGGALMPRGEGESRGTNIGVSAAVGGALPLSLSALNAATLPLRGQSRAAQEVADAIVPEGASGAQRRAVLQQTLAATRQPPPTAPAIPLSVSARLSNPELARLEAGSRARNGANWYDFDQGQARAVASAFDNATAEAADLATRRTNRSTNWNQNWGAAQQGADAARFAAEVPQLRANLDQAMLSAESSNPAVRQMLQAIADDIDRVTAAGAQYTPGHLQQIRANLSGKWHPQNDTAFTRADRAAPARLSVMQEVDDVLNRTTGNRWQNVVDNYAADSRLVDASKAAGKVRGAYYDNTGRVRGVSADPDGTVPKITEAGLNRALDSARQGNASLLSDPARQELEAILAALRRQGIVQGVKRSATAGGGSNTASDLMAAGAARAAGDMALNAVGGPVATAGRAAGGALMNTLNARKDRALAEALQDEQRFADLLQRQLRSDGTTMDRSEVIRLLRALRP